jgi:hypothetical protein
MANNFTSRHSSKTVKNLLKNIFYLTPKSPNIIFLKIVVTFEDNGSNLFIHIHCYISLTFIHISSIVSGSRRTFWPNFLFFGFWPVRDNLSRASRSLPVPTSLWKMAIGCDLLPTSSGIDCKCCSLAPCRSR